MVKPQLLYFDFNFWRGEVPRICFFVGGIEYIDKRLSYEEFGKMKSAGDLPLGQLPVLIYEGYMLTQAFAIIRFVGRMAGLLPREPLKVAKIDEVFHILEEMQGNLTVAFHEKDATTKRRMWEQIATISIPETMQKFEHLLAEGKTYFSGNTMTVADISVWNIIQWIRNGSLEQLPASCTEGFPALELNFQAVDNDPKIKEWKDSLTAEKETNT